MKRFLVVYDGKRFYVRRVLANNLCDDLQPSEMHYYTRPAKLTPVRRRALQKWLLGGSQT